jgi:quercetin dioxygenase-like cupin family protein
LFRGKSGCRDKARVSISGQPATLVSPGFLIYAPANVVHSVEALPDEDMVFFTVKDMSHGIVGTLADAAGSASK